MLCEHKEALCAGHHTLESAPLFYSSDEKRSDFHVILNQSRATIATEASLRWNKDAFEWKLQLDAKIG